MTLPADTSRCLGLLPTPTGEQRCERRETCARYKQRHLGGNGSMVFQWCCPGRDDYWQSYIPEVTDGRS